MAVQPLGLNDCRQCTHFAATKGGEVGQCQRTGTWIRAFRIRCWSYREAAMVGRAPIDQDGLEGACKVRQALSDIYSERLAEKAASKARLKLSEIKRSGNGAPVTTVSKSHFETKAHQNDERRIGGVV